MAVPPGSLAITMSYPRLSKYFFNKSICVVLPEPSGPSMVINIPSTTISSYLPCTLSKSNIILSEIFGSYRCLKFFKFPKEKQLYVQFDVLEELKYEDIKNETTVSLMERSKQLLENQLDIYRQKDEEYQKSIS